VRMAAIAAFGVAGLAGLLLSVALDWRLLVAGAACLLAGWLYTGGPRPYGYLGLGEVFVFLFFGLVATAGTVYVETGRVTPLAILAGCAMGFLACAILVLNNLRDIQTDSAAGKKTLATRIGLERTRVLLVALVCGAFAAPVAAVALNLAAIPSLLVLLAIPPAVIPVRIAFSNQAGPPLVGGLKRMAVAELIFALLFALGLLL